MPFGAAPAVTCIGTNATPGAAISRALAALDLHSRNLSLAALDNDDPALPGECLWLTLDAPFPRGRFARLVERLGEEQLHLIVQTPLELLDAVEDAFAGHDDRTVLVSPDETDAIFALMAALETTGGAVHASLPAERTRQIEQLQGEVQRISRMLARLARDGEGMVTVVPDGSREPPSPFIEDHVHAASRGWTAEPDAAVATVSAREVRQVIRQHRLRDEFFDSELFADPAWDMLLDLYAAKLDRGRVSVSSLCIASAVPATTALRWIKNLTDSGVFIRTEDPHDGRRIFVALSEDSTAAMHRYFTRLTDRRFAV